MRYRLLLPSAKSFTNSVRSFTSCIVHNNKNNKLDKLTHITEDGSAHMVDIREKEITHRTATAEGFIQFSNPVVSNLINSNTMKKGDVLGVARIAGIMAVKNTSSIIPLCHPIPVTRITNELIVSKYNRVISTCTVECDGKTGVEIEAIMGVLSSLATVYDMCKAVDKQMVISDVKVLKKAGGRSGDFEFKRIVN